jgi:signal transduction histidine kinase
MALFTKYSIKRNLVLILIGLVIFAALLQSGAYILFQIKVLEKDILRDLSVLSSSIGSTSRAAIIFEDKEAGKRILSSLSEEPQIDLAAIYDENHRLFVKYKRKENIPWSPPRLIGEGEMIDAKGIEIVKTIRFNEDVLGTIYIKANVKQLESHTVNYLSVIAAIFLLILLISIPLSMYLQKFISEPILALGETALNISKLNDYSLRAQYDQTNEIGVLYSEFNKMLSEIQTRDRELELYRLQLEDLVKERTKKLQETQKELLSKEKLAVMGTLSAMVSHELRNPLGTIRNSLFNISQIVDQTDSDAQGEIKRIERNIVRCDNIIEELLDFARPPGDNFQSVDLDSWLRDLIEEQEALKGLKVHGQQFRSSRCQVKVLQWWPGK